MAKDKKITRLSKVAREFNVGISTIVNFLNKKGYDIDSNPNAKVSPEQYNLLVDEYSTDSDVKKESKKINLEKSHESKHSISINDIEQEGQEEDTEVDESTEDEEIFIKDVSGKEQKKTTPKAKEESKEKEKTEKKEEKKDDKAEEEKSSKEEEKQEKEPKVVGKIDLDTVTK